MIGQVLIHVLFGIAVTATITSFLAWKREAFASVARILFGAFAIGITIASTLLIVAILDHDFRYTYVQAYSSINLPTHLLIASFYSGQEGSFMLWTFFVSIIGVILIPYARRHGYEAQVMSFYGLILAFLALLLVAKNPFSYVWESFAADGVQTGFKPVDGRGLNPLLHNAWITIHPPILFSGFAAMSVSFAFAMAGLVRRDYHRWISVALPWTLFGTAILGFGIMLGGFWAYETLGWGGFWGWDPVENSSLIPWLVSVALVHTMLVQRRTHGLVKTNMVLAVFAFVLVLYSTFLTRSGVLGDTSVHSFVDPGKFAFWILLLFMMTFLALGVGLVLVRRKDMNVNRQDFAPRTREFMLSIGSALLMASAVIVTIGTSWPVIMEVIGQPKVAVATDFYNRIHTWLLPAIMIVNAISLAAQWRHTTASVLRRNVIVAATVAVVASIITVILGITDVVSILLLASAWFSLAVNARIAWSFMRRSPGMLGAYVSHAGIALLVFGTVLTSKHSESHHAVLVQGAPTVVDDMTVTYLGKEQVERHFTDREKFAYKIRIERNGETIEVAPILYYSDFNKRSSAFLEPGIRFGILKDVYVSPKATGMEDVSEKATQQVIMRGTTVPMPVGSSSSITLERFTNPMEEGGPQPDGSMRMAAVVQLAGQDSAIKLYTVVQQGEEGMTFSPVWTSLPGANASAALVKIERNNEDPSQSKGTIAFLPGVVKPREIFTVEVSTKPLISLVWFGVIAMVAGFFLSIVRYARLSPAPQAHVPAASAHDAGQVPAEAPQA